MDCQNLLFIFIFFFPMFFGDCYGQNADETTTMEAEVYQNFDQIDTNFSMVYVNESDYEHNKPTNTTKHRGFLHGFVESITVILISELGDKTFFIAAIMAMTSNKLTVFLGAISALAMMTALSALLGFAVTTFIPRTYIYYTATAIMFLFGLKLLWDAWKMKPGELEEIQHEVEEELQRRGSIASSRSNPEPNNDDESLENGSADNADSQAPEIIEATPLNENGEGPTGEGSTEAKVKVKKRVTLKENSIFGKKCYKIFKVFVNCFTLTLLAEWGDRSQLATVVLAGVNDVFGVIVGGTIGHSICTGLAVIAGAIIAKKISVRVVTFIGALVFIGFAIASLFIDPEADQISIDM